MKCQFSDKLGDKKDNWIISKVLHVSLSSNIFLPKMGVNFFHVVSTQIRQYTASM